MGRSPSNNLSLTSTQNISGRDSESLVPKPKSPKKKTGTVHAEVAKKIELKRNQTLQRNRRKAEDRKVRDGKSKWENYFNAPLPDAISIEESRRLLTAGGVPIDSNPVITNIVVTVDIQHP